MVETIDVVVVFRALQQWRTHNIMISERISRGLKLEYSSVEHSIRRYFYRQQNYALRDWHENIFVCVSDENSDASTFQLVTLAPEEISLPLTLKQSLTKFRQSR